MNKSHIRDYYADVQKSLNSTYFPSYANYRTFFPESWQLRNVSPIVDELSLCSQLRTNTHIGILLSSYDMEEEQITNTGWDENTSCGFAENS